MAKSSDDGGWFMKNIPLVDAAFYKSLISFLWEIEIKTFFFVAELFFTNNCITSTSDRSLKYQIDHVTKAITLTRFSLLDFSSKAHGALLHEKLRKI